MNTIFPLGETLISGSSDATPNPESMNLFVKKIGFLDFALGVLFDEQNFTRNSIISICLLLMLACLLSRGFFFKSANSTKNHGSAQGINFSNQILK